MIFNTRSAARPYDQRHPLLKDFELARVRSSRQPKNWKGAFRIGNKFYIVLWHVEGILLRAITVSLTDKCSFACYDLENLFPCSEPVSNLFRPWLEMVVD